MQHRSQQTSLLWLLWLLGFVSLSNWGCNQNLFTLYPSAEEARETSPRQNVTPFRFGAVHYTYTDVYAQPLTQSERLTQCAYGEVVQLMQETPRWYGVKVG